MKKLNLSIPTPCHENWDQMSQAEKGKFCGACQKTVVDFTVMNDRQLVDFFKKPKDNVCGRFNDDQLDREILIPRKRIPWIKYFFQFTWPAFMLGLKSCTNATSGKVKNEAETKPIPKEMQLTSSQFETIQMHSVGLIMPEILPYEKKQIKSELIECKTDEVQRNERIITDSTSMEEDTILTGEPLDTVKIVTYGSVRRVLGGVRMVTTRIVYEDPVPPNPKKEITQDKFLAYPNPVNTGSMVTVKFPENNIPEKMQLISISGQIIAAVEQDISDYATMSNIRIPSHVASGVYFLRLLSKEKILSTIKIVVNR